MRPIIIGIAGGSGSGKTTLTGKIMHALEGCEVAIIQHDAYYRDLSYLPLEERDELNFDHPDALDTDLLITHLRELRAGRRVDVPIYDFATHTRSAVTRTLLRQDIILLEGVLIFAIPMIRELVDIKIYVDADLDTRFIRRLVRDIAERERSPNSVVQQYLQSVRPMHFELVEPSKQYADIIVSGEVDNAVAIAVLVTAIRGISRQATEALLPPTCMVGQRSTTP